MKAVYMQFFASFILSIPCTLTSFAIAWPSYSIAILKSDQSPLGRQITENEANIIGSIPMLGSLIFAALGGYVPDAIGRKRSNLLCVLTFALSWSLIATAKSVIQLIIGRFTCGLAAGLHITTVVVYVSEITQNRIRGTCLAGITVLYNAGTLLSYAEGWVCGYDTLCYQNISLAVVSVIIMSYLRETPSYLLRIGKEKEALASLQFYRGASTATVEVLEELAYIRNQREQGENTDTDLEKVEKVKDICNEEKGASDHIEKSSWQTLFCSKSDQRTLVTMSVIMILSISTGMIAVQTYAGQFFAMAAPSMSPHMCSVVLAMVMVVSSLLMVVVTDAVGRRPLMITTAGICTLCLAAIGSLLHWPGAPGWVIPLIVLIYCGSFQIGVVNVPFVQLAESFGPKVNSLATAIVVCCMFLSNFVILYLFAPVVAFLGLDGTFYLFCLFAALNTITSYLCMKETRGVPLEVIQQMYAQGYLYKKEHK